jgi:hypothetical protein
MTAWAGSALGGGAASLIAERVNRKRASAAVEVNDDGSIFTVADQKADAVAANSENLLNEAANSGDGFASADALTAAQEHQTDQDKLGNRRRIRIAFSAGALGARAGVSLGSGIKNAVTGGGKPSTSTLATEKPNSGTSNWSPAEKDAFKQMMKWRQEQLSINPTLTDQELAKGFNQYLQGIK